MDDVTKLAEAEDENIYRKSAKKDEGEKYRDPQSKTSKTARSVNRQNARKNQVWSDEELIRRSLSHFVSTKLLTDWLIKSFTIKSLVFDPEDLTFHFSKASGAGGQNVNKRETSVVCIHKPTLIQTRCEDTPSQEENRERAKASLKLKLEDHLSCWFELRRLNPDLVNETALTAYLNKILTKS